MAERDNRGHVPLYDEVAGEGQSVAIQRAGCGAENRQQWPGHARIDAGLRQLAQHRYSGPDLRWPQLEREGHIGRIDAETAVRERAEAFEEVGTPCDHRTETCRGDE